jgi:hypothetical protein
MLAQLVGIISEAASLYHLGLARSEAPESEPNMDHFGDPLDGGDGGCTGLTSRRIRLHTRSGSQRIGLVSI